jgi:predicted ester cyclase
MRTDVHADPRPTPQTESAQDSPSLPRSAFAPFTSVEEYILRCTDEIWVDRGVGLIDSRYYAEDVVLHGAYGTSRGVQPVVQGTLQSIRSFPDEVGFGEDVVWEQRGSGFVSAHRVYSTGTNTGWTEYGPPTGRHFEKRALAHCLVRDGRIVEEWVVRDEARLVTDLGFDLERLSLEIAERSPWRPLELVIPADPLRAGASGARPRIEAEDDCRRVLDAMDAVWNTHRHDRLSDHFSRDVVLHTSRGRTLQGLTQYSTETLDIHSAFPDARMRVLDVCAHDSARAGRRITAIWLLEGSYSGYGVYGTASGLPVQIIGASQFLVEGGSIHREFRVYDELALRVQIEQLRANAAASSAH